VELAFFSVSGACSKGAESSPNRLFYHPLNRPEVVTPNEWRQGYLFSLPQPAAEVSKMLSTVRTRFVA
jgi:hypothetical protein